MPGTEFEAITTQEEFESRLKDRLERERKSVRRQFEGFDEYKAKAEKADELQKKLDGIEAEKKRGQEVAAAAKEHGVDAELLARMSGDVADNAKYLAERKASQGGSRYPQSRDDGDKGGTQSTSPLAEAAHAVFGSRK